MDAYVIQKMLKDGLKDHITAKANKALWALCQQITSLSNAELKEEVKKLKEEAEAKKKANTRKFTGEERIDKLIAVYDEKIADGSLTAAELAQLKDIHGLKSKDRDISIEIVDYKNVYPEDADVYAVTSEIIKKKIAEANSEELHS